MQQYNEVQTQTRYQYIRHNHTSKLVLNSSSIIYRSNKNRVTKMKIIGKH